MRDATQSVWPLASVMQRAASNIITLDQYDVGDVPQWIQRQELPPPARASDAAATPPPVGYPLAPADAVELPRPIGVFIHIYHLDMAEMLLERVGRIDHPMQRYISTDDERKAQRIRELDPESIVRVFPNRGRDIYPKVYGFADAHRDHDVVLHLHTKRSVHDDGLGGWSDHILDRLLPSAGGVNAILRLFTEIESIGMVSPTLPVRWTAAPWWGRNRPLAELITWRTGWPPLPPGAELRFPAGSMFWARSTALAPVQALAPPESAFLPGIGGIDGTLAHTIERLIGVSCGVAGLEQFFIDSPGPAPWQRRLLEARDVATLIGTR